MTVTGPRVVGRFSLGGCFLIPSWRQEIIKDSSEVERRVDEIACFSLRPLAAVLSECRTMLLSEVDASSEDDETSWEEHAAEAASLLAFLVKEGWIYPRVPSLLTKLIMYMFLIATGDENYADLVKRTREEAHKAGLPVMLFSILAHSQASSQSAKQVLKKRKKKDSPREEQLRKLAANTCAALASCLKDEGLLPLQAHRFENW